MSKELIELSNALAQATDRAAASVVAVHTEKRGSSSGVIWRRGVIVTAEHALRRDEDIQVTLPDEDRKSTRLNSSHGYISYAVFCLKKTKTARPSSNEPPAAVYGATPAYVASSN